MDQKAQVTGRQPRDREKTGLEITESTCASGNASECPETVKTRARGTGVSNKAMGTAGR